MICLPDCIFHRSMISWKAVQLPLLGLLSQVQYVSQNVKWKLSSHLNVSNDPKLHITGDKKSCTIMTAATHITVRFSNSLAN